MRDDSDKYSMISLGSWMRILEVIDGSYSRAISVKYGLSQSNVSRIVTSFEDFNWVTSVRIGTKKYFYITRVGVEVLNDVRSLLMLVNTSKKFARAKVARGVV